MSYISKSFDERVVSLLKDGAVGFMPSDTIYGLSCHALNEQAVKRLHRIKNRDKSKPFIVLVSHIDQLNEMGLATKDAAPALSYWPGELTIIFEAPSIPSWLHMGTNSLAVRLPASAELRKLIDGVGPVISTSANLSGGKPAVNFDQASEYFGDQLDFYVDTGALVGQPSTIVKPLFGKLKIIRQGSLKVKQKDIYDPR